jgi:hypothetical protein
MQHETVTMAVITWRGCTCCTTAGAPIGPNLPPLQPVMCPCLVTAIVHSRPNEIVVQCTVPIAHLEPRNKREYGKTLKYCTIWTGSLCSAV